MSFSFKVRAFICALLLGIITCFSPAVTIIAQAVPAAVDYVLTTFEVIQLLQELGILNPGEYADVWESWYEAVKYDTQRDNLVSQGYIDESTPKESSEGVLNPDYLDAYIGYMNNIMCIDATRLVANDGSGVTFYDYCVSRYAAEASGSTANTVPPFDSLALCGEDFVSLVQDINSRHVPLIRSTDFKDSYKFNSFPQYACYVSDYNYYKFYSVVHYGSKQILGRNYSELYYLPFAKKDGVLYFTTYYMHLYYDTVDDSQNLIFDFTDLYNPDVTLSSPKSFDVLSGEYYVSLGFQSTVNQFRLGIARNSNTFVAGNHNSTTDIVTFTGGNTFYSVKDDSSLDVKTLFSSLYFESSDDIGFICSTEPFEPYYIDIDTTKIPNDDVIVMSGDTYLDYIITNNSGDVTNIYNYITNNYIYPGSGSSDDPGSGGTVNNWDIDFPDFLVNIGNTISNSIQTTFNVLFVPSDDFFENKFNEIQEKINLKLPFINDFSDIFNSLFVEINSDNEAYYPGLDIEAVDNEGNPLPSKSFSYPVWKTTINYFGKSIEIVFLDFNTIGPYLGTVRLCVTVFVYLLYLYRLWKYLPTLIGNVSSMAAVGVTAYDEISGSGSKKGEEE